MDKSGGRSAKISRQKISRYIVVSKQSRLLDEAETDAEKVTGFALSHTAVLHDPKVVDSVTLKLVSVRV